jgi:uncharacterized protein (TIGR00369 family)
MASSRALCNDNGTVHGGILLCAAETAAAGLADRSQREWTSSLRINYLRPLPPDDEVTFTAEIVHRGRSIAVYQVTGRGSAGRPAVVMMVTRTRQATETAGTGAAGPG